jgi:hypothetical protein
MRLERIGIGPVAELVLHILRARAVNEIGKGAVQWVPVEVSNVRIYGARANERLN